MEDFCSFCSKSSKESNVALLLNLDFVDDGQVIKFSTILSDVLPSLPNLEWICENCYIVIVKFFQLKNQVVEASEHLATTIKEELEAVTSCTAEGKYIDREDSCTADTNYIDQDNSFESIGADERIKFAEEETKPAAHDSKVEFAMEDDFSDLLVEVEEYKEPSSPSPNRHLRTRVVPADKPKHRKPKLKHIKGKTPKFLKPSKTSQVLGILSNGDLNSQQKRFVSEQVTASRMKHNLYNCTICSKTIHSYSGFRYHVVSKHILRSDPQKAVVAAKLEAGHRTSFIKGQKRESWECKVCSKEFNSHPAIRYHLNRHVIEGDLKIDS